MEYYQQRNKNHECVNEHYDILYFEENWSISKLVLRIATIPDVFPITIYPIIVTFSHPPILPVLVSILRATLSSAYSDLLFSTFISQPSNDLDHRQRNSTSWERETKREPTSFSFRCYKEVEKREERT